MYTYVIGTQPYHCIAPCVPRATACNTPTYQYLPACLPAPCLRACLPAYTAPANLLPTYLPSYPLPACLPTYRPTRLRHVRTYVIRTYVHNTHVRTYMHTFTHTYMDKQSGMHACIHAYPDACIPTHLQVVMSVRSHPVPSTRGCPSCLQ